MLDQLNSLLSAELVDALVATIVGIAAACPLSDATKSMINALFDIPILSERAADLDLSLVFHGDEPRTVRVVVGARLGSDDDDDDDDDVQHMDDTE